MKKTEFIKRYGEDGYQDMLLRRRTREKKPKKREAVPTEYGQNLMQELRIGPLPEVPQSNSTIMSRERSRKADKVTERWRRTLMTEWKKTYPTTQAIITIDSRGCKAGMRLNFELVCLKWTDEQRQWFKDNVDKINLQELK